MLKLPSPQKTADLLRKVSTLRPRLGIVLGSGFQAVARHVNIVTECNYRKLPGFCPARIEGHEGRLLLGTLGDETVAVLSGRIHYYEGHSLATVAFPVRVLAALGIETVVLTNAAGAINRRFRAGDFMAITDHLNLIGESPLRGATTNGKSTGTSEPTPFIDLTRVYDQGLQRLLNQAAKRAKVKLWSGVYAAVPGPNFETPAEIRAFRRLGADAVGMSTVPEAIVARQCRLRVAGISCLTNMAAGITAQPLSHQEVLEMGQRAAQAATGLLETFAELHRAKHADRTGNS